MCAKHGAIESVERLLVDSYILSNERRSETIILLIWFSQRFDKGRSKDGEGHLCTFRRAMVRSALFAVMSFLSPRRVAIVT